MNSRKPLEVKSTDVRLSGVSKRYGLTTALEHIDLDVRAGEFMTFLGPSGGGKTTTLNLIAGFDEPSTGEVSIGGRSMRGVPPHRRDIGMVFQNYALFPHMTVDRNVAYPLVQRKVPKAEQIRRVREALKSVGLDGFGGRRPVELSGGQQQRVALARAMVFRPGLLLMDEPLGALDRSLREELQIEIRRIHREQGSTAVYVTHDQEEALVLSDRIAVFSHGRIQQVGSSIELYEHPATLFVGRFVGESTILVGRVADVTANAVRVDGDFGSAWVDGSAALGDDVAILVRPERQDVSRAASTEPGVNSIPVMVVDRIFVGSTWKYRLELRDGSIGIVRMHNAVASDVRPGETAWISWAVGTGVLLPVDGDSVAEDRAPEPPESIGLVSARTETSPSKGKDKR